MATHLQIRIAQDEAADEVLSDDPFALLVGMLLDQQYPMEHAFRGPWQDPRPVRHAGPGADRRRPSPRPSPTCARRRRRSTATAGRWPGASSSWPRSCATSTAAAPRRSGPRRPTRADLRRPAQGPARVRRPEGADLRRPGGQAARRAARGLAGGDRPLRRGRLLPLGGRRRRRRRRCRRCASSSRPPRPPPRPRPPPVAKPSGPRPDAADGRHPEQPTGAAPTCGTRHVRRRRRPGSGRDHLGPRHRERPRRVDLRHAAAASHLRSIEGKLDSAWW